jgi:hypothetical protein
MRGMEALKCLLRSVCVGYTPISVLDGSKYYYYLVVKELRALEIIDKKGLSTNELWFIKNDKSFEEYTETLKELYWGDEALDKWLKTEDEFKLLREVFYEPVGKV